MLLTPELNLASQASGLIVSSRGVEESARTPRLPRPQSHVHVRALQSEGLLVCVRENHVDCFNAKVARRRTGDPLDGATFPP